MPFWNVFDIFALSLFLSVSIGIFFVSIGELFMTRKFLLPILVDGIVNLLIFTICSSLFFKSKLKDGSIGFITYAVLVIMQSGTSIWLRGKTAFAHILAEDIFLFLLTLVFLMLFFYKQYIVSHVKKK